MATRERSDNLVRDKGGAFAKYKARIVGSDRASAFLLHELYGAFLAGFPGAAGLFLRQKICRRLLGKCGRGVGLYSGVTIRCPKRLFIGDNTLIDKGVFFDIKSAAATVRLGARNQIQHGASFETGYDGHVVVGDDCYIGPYSILNGFAGITIGNHVLIAGHCHLVAGDHGFRDLSRPMAEQPITGTGIHLEDDVWLGSGVKILDGVRIGRGSIVCAGAVVNRDVAPFSIVGGIPAKLIRTRRAPDETG